MEMSQWTISWNIVMSITTVKSFSSMQKKASEIFHFFHDFKSFCVDLVMSTSPLIYINQNLE